MDGELAGFGQEHLGEAELGDRRRTDRLLRVADKVAAHPGRSLPHAMQSPADLVALYRLCNRQEVTHQAVLETHLRRTRSAIRAHRGVVLVAHDDTELDLTSKRSLREQLGPRGGHDRYG